VTQFAAVHAEKADMFTSLGLDWKALGLQTVAFLVLLVLLRKFVYPPLVEALDKRDAQVRAGAKAARQAQKAADESEARTAAMLKNAQRESRAIIRYISSNQFVQDLIRAIRRNAIDRFKHYYQSLDVLLIDDIQFLSDKQRSQEEFFHVFETMTINQRQIVITCDTYPKELKGIDDRLISRLNSGLIVAIEPPELEMRVAILQRKAEQARIRLPDDVAYFIAKNIRRNVRELEGALQRAIHYASFRSSPLTLELVKEALKDLISFNRGQISIDFIQKTVAEYYKIKQADMYSKRKPAKIALPRQIAMYLAKELTQKSLPEIGDAFGGKDHTTVLYAVRKITELRAHDEDLNKQIHVLDQTLREYL